MTFIIYRTKRHIQNLTSFHGWLDPTIIYRDPVFKTTFLNDRLTTEWNYILLPQYRSDNVAKHKMSEKRKAKVSKIISMNIFGRHCILNDVVSKRLLLGNLVITSIVSLHCVLQVANSTAHHNITHKQNSR
jgi:hypothetical protein